MDLAYLKVVEAREGRKHGAGKESVKAMCDLIRCFTKENAYIFSHAAAASGNSAWPKANKKGYAGFCIRNASKQNGEGWNKEGRELLYPNFLEIVTKT